MSAPVVEGEVLAGKYRVEKVLGQGGMGVVVAAMHLQLEQKVALKFLLPNAIESPEAVARFLREARASVKLRGEHVAKVTDVGTLESGSPYMVMEFLQGHDLSDIAKARGPMPLSETVDYLLQAAEAVAEAHSAGIVHRDLKPANFFITKRHDGTPLLKVLDFGISKMNNGNEAAMTRTTAMMGTPYYMSPEQMRSSRNVDARSDIWALGVILFELLAGRVAFTGETMPELCANVLTSPTPLLRSLRPELPVAIENVVQRCLSKELSGRYADVAELARDLAPHAPEHALIHVDRIQRILGAVDVPPARSSLTSFADTVVGAQMTPPSITGNASSLATQGTAAPLSLGTSNVALGTATAAAWDGPAQRPAGGAGTKIAIAVFAIASVSGALFFGLKGSQSTPAPVAATTADSAARVAPSAPPVVSASPPPSAIDNANAPIPSAAHSSSAAASAAPSASSRVSASPRSGDGKLPVKGAAEVDEFSTSRH